LSQGIEETIEYFRKKFDREKIQQDIDAALEKTKKFFQEDSPNTTVIHGDNYWGTCYRHACYLAKYIYSLPGNPNFTTEYPEKMTEVEEHWQQWDFLDHASGLMAALFKQKNYDPASEKALCPPTLVFRGTDFDDFRGLGALVRFQVSKWGAWKTFRYCWVGDSDVSATYWERLDFADAGYEEHLLYEEESIVNGLLAKPFGFDIDVDINTKIELYLYTKGGYGDWNNNITQGIGKESTQYKDAIQFGRDIVEEKIKYAADKRLIVTGHSLGGGLAATTNCVLEAEYPSLNFRSIIFNAAGVHRNTIAREIEPEARAMSSMSSHSCIDICVQDEILTTLGAYHKKLPILGSVFTYVARHLGQHGLPNPSEIAQLHNIPGYSPGTTQAKQKGNSHMELPPKGVALRRLFPIEKQNVTAMPRPDGFPLITTLDNFFQSSFDISDVLTKLLKFLNNRYGEAARKISDTPLDTYKKMLEYFMNDVRPELDVIALIMSLSSEYHGMDIVIASYEEMLLERKLNDEQKAQKAQQREDHHEFWRVQEEKKEKQRREDLAQRMKYHKYQPGESDWQNLPNIRF